MLTINKTVENGKAVLMPEGRIDTVTAPEMDKIVKELLPTLTDLTFDFEKLTYISSAGLRILLTSQKVMNKQGTMKLINVNQTVLDILDVAGFVDILTIE